ncbi:ion channel protein [Streptomyces sp. NPDC006684]|uniref:ion channel protein n=1 Tax=Streptomyces sp. NPDC006684 TaxID=3154477 RepID=UPI003451B75B
MPRFAPVLTPTARRLAPLTLPALVTGVLAACVLLGVSWVAERLQGVWWGTVPEALGLGRYAAGWVVLVLTCTGVLTGLVVRYVPGHAGPDPATTGLVDAPLPLAVLPGLLLATVLSLAGGVSLGPENPITAVNVALVYAAGRRLSPRVPGELWTGLAAAGTIGALFGTPVAAALVLTEMLTERPGPALWDRLYAPLLAGAAGALTMTLVAEPSFDLALPPYGEARWAHLLPALLICLAGAVLGLCAVAAFPYAHGAFARLGHPVLVCGAGGLVLGGLGVLGGHLTLFKGLDEVKELSAHPGHWSAGALAGMAVVRTAALLVAASSGFRGGRIFPAVFVGVALGLSAHQLFPGAAPEAPAAACGVLGVLLAVTRQGWLSLFTAAVLVADTAVLPLLCLAALPAWLLVTGRPPMRLGGPGPVPEERGTAPVA